ncbi:phosphoheptose isomerase [bacterium]|nr:phosphoheptose isomerase [bacterium]
MNKKFTTKEYVKASLSKTMDLLRDLINLDDYIFNIQEASQLIVDSISSNHTIYLAGNGGSAAQSQHFAAELVSRFNFDRNPLPAVALTTDTSVLTAVSNDYGYEKVFERQLAGLAQKGDVFIGFSTSGTSKNILNCFKKAREMKLSSIGISGEVGMKESRPDILISIPSQNTPLIQEIHCITSHLICDIVEKTIFN